MATQKQQADAFVVVQGHATEDAAYMITEAQHYRLETLMESMEAMAELTGCVTAGEAGANVTASLFRLMAYTIEDITAASPYAVRRREAAKLKHN